MIVNPIALATKGFIGNDQNVTLSTKGFIDEGEAARAIDPGGYVGFVAGLREEEELMLIIQSFLTMRR